MTSGYTPRRSGGAGRRIWQVAGVIALSLFWTRGRTHVLATAEEVSLRGSSETSNNSPLLKTSADDVASSSSETSADAADLPQTSADDVASSSSETSADAADLPPAGEVVCDTVGQRYAAIRSKKESVKVRCRGGFAVYDVPKVGEVFAADCKNAKELESKTLKATLDHRVDDTGAFRTLTVSQFSPEDDQFCLVCAQDDGVRPAGVVKAPENRLCSVVVTVVGTNNKMHKTEEPEPEQEQPAQLSEEDKELPQESVPESQASKTQQSRQHRHSKKEIPRQPQQQMSEGEMQPRSQGNDPQQRRSPSPVLEIEEAARPSEQGDEQATQQEVNGEPQDSEGSVEGHQDTATNDGQDKQQEGEGESASDSANENKKSSPASPLQCEDADLHVHVPAGKSVSFVCGHQRDITPDRLGFVYTEQEEGKCGGNPESISDLVPEADITNVEDATVVTVALGLSEKKTVCYKCVKSQQQQEEDGEEDSEDETETTSKKQAEGCNVFLTLQPNVAAPSPKASSASYTCSSFPLLSALVFLSAFLHLP